MAALSERFPEEGGIYVWTRRGFGDWHGFLCGWCYWLSNLFYFPSLLLAGVGMAATALGFAENRIAIIAIALAILWIASITNIVGLGVGKWTGNLGGLSTYLGRRAAGGAWAWWCGCGSARLRRCGCFRNGIWTS